MIAALVPVKRLDAAKSRLRISPFAEASPGLARAMLEDVVEALLAVQAIDLVAVVSDDPEVAKAAEELGARALMVADVGLNPSLDAAAERLADEGPDALLVVLGDVAGVRPGDIEELLATGASLAKPAVALAASSDGGTAALLRTPPDAIPSAFGPDSAARHRELAHSAGVAFRSLDLPSLALDLDGPEDVDAFLAAPTGGRRTRALLQQIDWKAQR